MTISDWVIAMAAIAGPILAVQAQQWLARWQEKKDAKLWVFRQLMANRSVPASQERVQALNTIDIVFYNTKDVRAAWKALFDSYCTGTQEKQETLYIELLHVMARSLRYDFDPTDLKNQSYSPVIHGKIEGELHTIRHGLAEMLKEGGPLQMKVVELPGADEAQRKVSQALVEMYTSGKPWPVKIVVE